MARHRTIASHSMRQMEEQLLKDKGREVVMSRYRNRGSPSKIKEERQSWLDEGR